MIDYAYWDHIFKNHAMSEKVSDASYPCFEGACRMDVVDRHIVMTKFFMRELE